MTAFDTLTPRKAPLWRRAQTMVVSAAYTSASFLASAGTVVVIGRDLDVSIRAAFFLFLAIFSPLTTILAQKSLLSIYQGKSAGRALAVVEESLLFVATLALIAWGTWPPFGLVEVAVLASTIFTHIWAVTATGTIQHASNNRPAWAFIALALAGVRIGMTWAFLAWGPVVAFAAGSYSYLVVSLALKRLALRGRHAEAKADAADGAGGREDGRSRLAMLGFLMMSALTFQVDKYLLGGAGQDQAVADSGALTLILLSPVSLLFATIYRQRTRALFDPDRPARAKLGLLARIGGQFLALVGIYALALGLVWNNALLLALPFLTASYLTALVFVLAVVLDRLAMLLAFAGQTPRLNAVVAVYKVCALGAIWVASGPIAAQGSLTGIYALYVAASVGYIAVVSFLVFRKPRP